VICENFSGNCFSFRELLVLHLFTQGLSFTLALGEMMLTHISCSVDIFTHFVVVFENLTLSWPRSSLLSSVTRFTKAFQLNLVTRIYTVFLESAFECYRYTKIQNTW
jgi:hypothetical protein